MKMQKEDLVLLINRCINREKLFSETDFKNSKSFSLLLSFLPQDERRCFQDSAIFKCAKKIIDDIGICSINQNNMICLAVDCPNIAKPRNESEARAGFLVMKYVDEKFENEQNSSNLKFYKKLYNSIKLCLLGETNFSKLETEDIENFLDYETQRIKIEEEFAPEKLSSKYVN